MRLIGSTKGGGSITINGRRYSWRGGSIIPGRSPLDLWQELYEDESSYILIERETNYQAPGGGDVLSEQRFPKMSTQVSVNRD